MAMGRGRTAALPDYQDVTSWRPPQSNPPLSARSPPIHRRPIQAADRAPPHCPRGSAGARSPSRRIVARRRLALLSDSEQKERRCRAWSVDDPSLGPDRCLAPAQWEASTGRIALDQFGERDTKPFARQRAIIVDPGDRWQLRQVGCIRHYFRKRYSARKFCEEGLVHSAVKSAVDRGSRQIVFNQLRVSALVGAPFFQRPPRDFRIDDE